MNFCRFFSFFFLRQKSIDTTFLFHLFVACVYAQSDKKVFFTYKFWILVASFFFSTTKLNETFSCFVLCFFSIKKNFHSLHSSGQRISLHFGQFFFLVLIIKFIRIRITATTTTTIGIWLPK